VIGGLLEKIFSTGLRPKDFLSAVLDEKLDLDLIFFSIILFLSVLASLIDEFTG